MRLLAVGIGLLCVVQAKNNVCNTTEDYFVAGSGNCWYDPDAESTIWQLAANHGHPLVEHKVKTPDGYTLSLFRIYNEGDTTGRSRQPIYLQHGIASACTAFMINGNESLAFMLDQSGYDVWLGNVRGNQYSRNHVKYSPGDRKFWNFSFHESAIYDVPCMLDFIYEQTGRKDVIYIGHSMGTKIAYAYASTYPDHSADRLKLIVSLAPTVFMGNPQSSNNILSNVQNTLMNLQLGKNFEIAPNNPALYKKLCFSSHLALLGYRTFYFRLFGSSPNQFKPETVPVFLQHTPSGVSSKTLQHYLQMSLSARFTPYDYGSVRNKLYYNRTTPPDYDLSRVAVMSFLMFAANDQLASEENVFRLINSLRNVEFYKITNSEFNHMDLLIGRDAVTEVNDKLLEYIERYRS